MRLETIAVRFKTNFIKFPALCVAKALSLFAPVAFAFTAVAAACERQTPMAIDRVQGRRSVDEAGLCGLFHLTSGHRFARFASIAT